MSLDAYLVRYRTLGPRYEVAGAMAQEASNRLWQPWGDLLEAHDANDEYWTRYHLGQLRLALGEADYYAGFMPPPVPWWFFPERD